MRILKILSISSLPELVPHAPKPAPGSYPFSDPCGPHAAGITPLECGGKEVAKIADPDPPGLSGNVGAILGQTLAWCLQPVGSVPQQMQSLSCLSLLTASKA